MQTVGEYQIQQVLGEGGFGVVYKASKSDGVLVALKQIKKLKKEQQKYIKCELDIIKQKLNHENIVKMYDYLTDETGNIYIALELCTLGDLNNFFVDNDVRPQRRLQFMSDMARGVNYLHAHSVVHRDLKPENILLSEKNEQITCKISDFGISKIRTTITDRFDTLIGSPAYMAPEIGKMEYAGEVDVFALGLLFFAVYKHSVLTNYFGEKSLIPGVYNDKGSIAFLTDILRKNRPNSDSFVQCYFNNSSADVGQLVFNMLSQEPENRPEIGEILEKITEIRITEKLNERIKRQDKSVQDLQQQNGELRNELLAMHRMMEKEALEREKLQQQYQKQSEEIDKLKNEASLNSLKIDQMQKKQMFQDENHKTEKQIVEIQQQIKLYEGQQLKFQAECNETEARLKDLHLQMEGLQQELLKNENLIHGQEEENRKQLTTKVNTKHNPVIYTGNHFTFI